MLQFETLLVQQLQRQQSRAEFCDTVLQSQGVSVPVHSCVLSAFSPWLCGALSTMPAPQAGQRRLIELQHVEACTLLSLVSLLYSGQLHGNQEDILSAADLLGIKLPQQHSEERYGGKDMRRKGSLDAEQQNERHPQGAVGQDSEKGEREEQKARESCTQTESEKMRDERETQTDNICFDSQQNRHVNGHSTCSSPRQEQDVHTSAPDTTVMLQGAQISPEKIELAVAPQTGVCNIVSEPVCLSQYYLYPPEFSYHQPSTFITPHCSTSTSTYMEIGHYQSQQVDMSVGTGDVVEGFEQFEGNIPGFINFFLDPTHSKTTMRKGRGRSRGRGTGRSRENAKGEGAVRNARVRSRGGGKVRRGGRGQWKKNHTERWGWVPMLAWRGQGGGRVGRKVDTRPSGKQSVISARGRRGRGALLQVGKRRGRGRPRQRGREGTFPGSKGQDAISCLSSLRVHPPLSPLPLSPCPPPFMHTQSFPPAPQVSIQPVDMFLDDIMAGFNFLTPVNTEDQSRQHGSVSDATPSTPSKSMTVHPSLDSSGKPTDFSQQQPERELCDILDHFLNTIDQHVGGSDLDVMEQTSTKQSYNYPAPRSGGPQVNRDTGTDSWGNVPKLQPIKPHLVHCDTPHADISPHCTQSSDTSTPDTSTPKTQHQAVRSSRANTSHTQNNQSQLSPPCYKESKQKLRDVEKKDETRRITRSQTMKRKLGTVITSLPTPAPKMKCRESRCSVPAAQRKKERQQLKHAKRTEEEKRHKPKSSVETNLAAGSQTCHAPVMTTLSGNCIEMTSTALEKMRILLEKQMKRKEQHLRAEKRVRMCTEKEHMTVQESLYRAKEELPAGNTSHDHSGASKEVKTDGSTEKGEERERTVHSETEAQEEPGEVRCRQENGQSMASRPGQVMTNECSTQVDLLLNTDSVESNREGLQGECNNNMPVLSTAESTQSCIDLCSRDVLPSLHAHPNQKPSPKGIMINMINSTLGSCEKPPTTPPEKLKFLLQLSPNRELFPSHTPKKNMQESVGSSEEEEVDVVEVSSSDSEPIAISPVTCGLSTEEEDGGEDVEVDVLVVESD